MVMNEDKFTETEWKAIRDSIEKERFCDALNYMENMADWVYKDIQEEVMYGDMLKDMLKEEYMESGTSSDYMVRLQAGLDWDTTPRKYLESRLIWTKNRLMAMIDEEIKKARGN